MRVIITGGGTGGHIYPALSVGKALEKEGWDILYIGSADGLEKKIVPAEGLKYKTVAVAPLPRKLTPQLFLSLLKTSKGLFQARQIIKDFQPDITLGTGGFVAGPVVLATSLLGIPTIIHEQNVYPGITNRLLSYRVDKIALNFAEASKYFPKRVSKKISVTGNPIREVILNTTREEGLRKLQLNPHKKTLLVFGGSQGSMSINQAMLEVYKYSRSVPWLQIIHITGEANYDKIIKEFDDLGINSAKYDNFIIKPYLHNMEWAYAVADLIISRAGATGLAEITAKGIPAILVPFPYAAGNHQDYNARNMEKHGAGIVIADKDLTGKLLIEKIRELFQDEKKLKDMGENSCKLGQPEARDNIIREMKELYHTY